jgi:hypothetical protein
MVHGLAEEKCGEQCKHSRGIGGTGRRIVTSVVCFGWHMMGLVKNACGQMLNLEPASQKHYYEG